MKASVLATLLAALWLSLATGKESDLDSNARIDAPLDFLVFSTEKDLEINFGYKIIEHVRSERMRCQIKANKQELKFSEKLDHLMSYHQQSKQAVNTPEFEALSLLNRKDIENNFKKTFNDIEFSHFRKVDHIQVDCDALINDYMADRLKKVVFYANNVLSYSRESFDRLLSDMLGYQAQLHYGLRACVFSLENYKEKEQISHLKFYDRCYGNEVEMLIEFIDKFAMKAGELVAKLANKPEVVSVELPSEKPVDSSSGDGSQEDTSTDQEEGDVSDYEVSSGDDKKVSDDKEHSKTADGRDGEKSKQEDKTPGDNKDEQDEEEKRVDNDKDIERPRDKDESKEKTKPDETVDKPKEEPTTDQTPTSTERSEPQTKPLSKEEVAEWFHNNQGPGPVIIDPSEKPADDDDIADRAFEKVMKMQDDGKRAKSTNNGQLSLDLDLPGADAGISVEVGPEGVVVDGHQGGEEEVIFEYQATTESPAPEDHKFRDMFFIYFFSTLGALIGLTLLVTVVTIVCVRATSPGVRKDTPLLSEEAKIEVMKKSGYVNPTYNYFDQQQDV